MPNFLQSAAEWLADVDEEHNATTITYRRGNKSVTLTAKVGQTDNDTAEQTPGRMQSEWADKDYLIRAADLILGGEVASPEPGDRIVEGSVTREVAPAADGPHWRWSDDYEIRLRVHTKR